MISMCLIVRLKFIVFLIHPTCGVDEGRHQEEGEQHEEDRHELPRAPGAKVRLEAEARCVGAPTVAGWPLSAPKER